MVNPIIARLFGYGRVLLHAKDPLSLVKAILIKGEEELLVERLGIKRRISSKKTKANFDFSFFMDSLTLSLYYQICSLKAYSDVPQFVPKQGDIIFDLGAHEGIYSLYASKNAPNGKIFSVEPDPDNLFWLQKNISINKITNIHVIDGCVGEREGEVLFEKGVTSGTGKPLKIGNKKGGSFLKETDRILKVHMTTTLDRLVEEYRIDHIDILKIDVEGYELEVLHGGTNALKHTLKIVMEWHSPQLKKDVCNLLSKYGFVQVKYDNPLLPHTLYFYKPTI